MDRSTTTIRLGGSVLANGPGYVDVCDHSGCYGLTLKGTPDELEALAANLKAAAALERTRTRPSLEKLG